MWKMLMTVYKKLKARFVKSARKGYEAVTCTVFE